MIGVAFYDGLVLHCGITNGTEIIDSRWPQGIMRRPLPPEAEVVWVEGCGACAWERALKMVGRKYVLCGTFVSACMDIKGHALPKILRRKLEARCAA